MHLAKEGGRERGRYGGERLSETSVGGVNSNLSSAMALALLHTHDARSRVYFHRGYSHSLTELNGCNLCMNMCVRVCVCVCGCGCVTEAGLL